MSRALRGKLPVVIKEGDIRPLNPVVASKFATQCNIIVRSYIPILPKWKDYTVPSAAPIHRLFRLHLAVSLCNAIATSMSYNQLMSMEYQTIFLIGYLSMKI